MDLDLRLVRYAVFLADELHFARAAARLHIAQQTLSAQISHLEDRLGVTLFERDRRHVELTPAGSVFIAHGRKLLDEANELFAELHGTPLPLRVDVITEGLTAGIVARELRPKLPDVLLEVVQGHGLAATLSAVVDGRVDLAFGWVEGLGKPLPATLSQELVRWEPIGVVVPAAHPLATLDAVRMRDLIAHPLIIHTAEEAVDWQAWNEAAAGAFGLRVGWRLHGHGRDSANAAVLAYHAPAFAPLGAPLLEGIVSRPIEAPVPLCPVSVVWRSSGRMPARRRRAVGAIHEIARGHGWLTRPATDHWLPALHEVTPPAR
ncbi:LysR family transcriptional regulator [Nocardia pseudovaccinii]|uniref:LysR family transcriptional regulator n=1 Tax=Nocardia pseudovaccinii TaxID=189540 RepID=UPI0007A3ADF9|nr:LysR family transcriptional regulator [Nocardia pseudovaccinii]